MIRPLTFVQWFDKYEEELRDAFDELPSGRDFVKFAQLTYDEYVESAN